MAMAKKGSRRIDIDDVIYRWRVSAQYDIPLVAVVELSENPGQKLQAHFDWARVLKPPMPDGQQSLGQRRSISPAAIRAVVLAALCEGWQPGVRGLPDHVIDGDKVKPLDPG